MFVFVYMNIEQWTCIMCAINTLYEIDFVAHVMQYSSDFSTKLNSIVYWKQKISHDDGSDTKRIFEFKLNFIYIFRTIK